MKTKARIEAVWMKLITVALCILLFSCTSRNSKHTEAEFLMALENVSSSGVQLHGDVVASVLEQIPSPLEISMLLKYSGVHFNRTILNSTQNLSRYNTNYKKALNLGIYGADLGYSNIYEQNGDGIRYLASIKALADDLRIGQFFDLNTISRLAASSNNLDSLLLVTTQNFNSVNYYLQSQDRSHLSVLLLIGGWLEGMQILCQVAAQYPANQQLMERIGEQKIVLEQFMLLLSFYSEDESMSVLNADLAELKEIFEKVSITHTYRDASIEIIDGVAVIKDNSTTTINITDHDAAAIRNKVSSIRSKIIS